MEILKENSISTLMEEDIGNSPESFQKFIEAQKDLFHSQIDHLEKIVLTQCKLTGVNPLSQEMAAGALSINIGKRPRDLLNPKAVKYMQSIFSIKDTLTKKETREISAHCGVTLTQVREFFAGQRSRVRKFVRLAREKAIKSDADNSSQDGCSSSYDISMPIMNPVPLNSVDPKAIEESPSCSTQEDIIPGIDDFDKKFVMNIFTLMKKEESFSGQVKLMEWMLQIQNASVLYWFVTKDGLMILAAWLSQATLEEQTTVLLVILKVLNHLPLHKALPVQMSAILQTVNRLRFFRTSDISNKAKALLSRWSKLFVRSQALKRPPSTLSPIDAQREKNSKQSDLLSNEWQSNIDIPEDILSFALENAEDCRKSESSPLKLLQASPDDPNKKQLRGVSSIQTRERRKVLPMEQPDRNTNGRTSQVARAMQGRPMSADDIQKAKIRAMHMQSKYGKTVSPTNENRLQKTEDANKSSPLKPHPLRSALKNPVQPKIEVGKKAAVISRVTTTPAKAPTDLKALVPRNIAFVPSTPPKATMDTANISPLTSTPPRAPMNSNPMVPGNIASVPSTPPKPTIDSNPTVPANISPVASTPPKAPTDSNRMVPAKISPVSSTPPRVPMNSNSMVPANISLVTSTPPKAPTDSKPMVPANIAPVTSTLPKAPTNSLPRVLPQHSSLEKLKNSQIPWHSPPEIRINTLWRIGEGENSKEVEIQTGRMRREKEIIYHRIQDIPPNPKEPWDVEMNYDDTLTPKIPMEQSLDALPPPQNHTEAFSTARIVENTPETSITATTSGSIVAAAPEPDFELLAVLLRNPELVFALTGQANNLTSADTMRLLDIIKQSGAGSSGVLNGPQREEVVAASLPSPTPPTRSLPSPTPPTRSLPSPTPSAERLTNGWISGSAMDSSSQPVTATTNRESYGFHQASPSVALQEQLSANALLQFQSQASNYLPQQATFAPAQQQLPFLQNSHSGSNPHPGQQQFMMTQMNPIQNQAPHPQNNYMPAALASMQPEPVSYGQMQGVKPAQITITLNPPNRAPITLPAMLPHSSAEPPYVGQHLHPTAQWNSVGNSRQMQMTDTWSHGNQNNYHGNRGGPVHPSWEINEYVAEEPDFETWSPEMRSPRSRSPGYHSGRNYSEPRRDSSRNSRPPDWSRQPRDSNRRDHRPQDYTRQGSRKWRDRSDRWH